MSPALQNHQTNNGRLKWCWQAGPCRDDDDDVWFVYASPTLRYAPRRRRTRACPRRNLSSVREETRIKKNYDQFGTEVPIRERISS